MRIVLVTTKKDYAPALFERECRKQRIPFKVLLYSDLAFIKNQITDARGKRLDLKKGDAVILRDPYYKNDYAVFMRALAEQYPEYIAFDRKCIVHFPYYEDKLFQTHFFHRLGIIHPNSWYAVKPHTAFKFPVIVKKRISSRSQGNTIIQNKTALRAFFQQHNPAEYIIQEYQEVRSDFRILMLRDQIIGITRRDVFIHDDGTMHLKTAEQIDLSSIPQSVLKQAVIISKASKADFLGIDLIQYTNGKYFFLESNLMPQYNKFEVNTGINVTALLIEQIKK